MSTNIPFQPRPAEFKTTMDGLGGLVRIRLTGGLHDGRELFMDEPDVPDEIFATPRQEPFEWWPARQHRDTHRGRRQCDCGLYQSAGEGARTHWPHAAFIDPAARHTAEPSWNCGC